MIRIGDPPLPHTHTHTKPKNKKKQKTKTKKQRKKERKKWLPNDTNLGFSEGKVFGNIKYGMLRIF